MNSVVFFSKKLVKRICNFFGSKSCSDTIQLNLKRNQAAHFIRSRQGA